MFVLDCVLAYFLKVARFRKLLGNIHMRRLHNADGQTSLWSCVDGRVDVLLNLVGVAVETELHVLLNAFILVMEIRSCIMTCRYIFGIPGEENLDLLDSLRNSSIKLVVTRHEQAAGFMAATVGRLTGKAGCCLSTLGPGATNFTTAAAYAQLAGFPMVSSRNPCWPVQVEVAELSFWLC